MKKIITLIALTTFTAFSTVLGPSAVRADSGTGEQTTIDCPAVDTSTTTPPPPPPAEGSIQCGVGHPQCP